MRPTQRRLIGLKLGITYLCLLLCVKLDFQIFTRNVLAKYQTVSCDGFLGHAGVRICQNLTAHATQRFTFRLNFQNNLFGGISTMLLIY